MEHDGHEAVNNDMERRQHACTARIAAEKRKAEAKTLEDNKRRKNAEEEAEEEQVAPHQPSDQAARVGVSVDGGVGAASGPRQPSARTNMVTTMVKRAEQWKNAVNNLQSSATEQQAPLLLEYADELGTEVIEMANEQAATAQKQAAIAEQQDATAQQQAATALEQSATAKKQGEKDVVDSVKVQLLTALTTQIKTCRGLLFSLQAKVKKEQETLDRLNKQQASTETLATKRKLVEMQKEIKRMEEEGATAVGSLQILVKEVSSIEREFIHTLSGMRADSAQLPETAVRNGAAIDPVEDSAAERAVAVKNGETVVQDQCDADTKMSADAPEEAEGEEEDSDNDMGLLDSEGEDQDL